MLSRVSPGIIGETSDNEPAGKTDEKGSEIIALA